MKQKDVNHNSKEDKKFIIVAVFYNIGWNKTQYVQHVTDCKSRIIWNNFFFFYQECK